MKPLAFFPFNRFGVAVDPRGENVALTVKDRTYLGTVQSIERNEHGLTHATVRHFNGELWPFAPALSALGWIKRDWPEESCAD